MPTSVLTVGTGEGTSSDITVTSPTVIGIKVSTAPSTTRGASIVVQLKDDLGAYYPVATLEQPGIQAVILHGPGTYRVYRSSSSEACGAFTG